MDKNSNVAFSTLLYTTCSLNGHVAFGDITIYESQLLRNCRPGLSL